MKSGRNEDIHIGKGTEKELKKKFKVVKELSRKVGIGGSGKQVDIVNWMKWKREKMKCILFDVTVQ